MTEKIVKRGSFLGIKWAEIDDTLEDEAKKSVPGRSDYITTDVNLLTAEYRAGDVSAMVEQGAASMSDNHGNMIVGAVFFSSEHGELRKYRLNDIQWRNFYHDKMLHVDKGNMVSKVWPDAKIPVPNHELSPLEWQLHELEEQKAPYTVVGPKAKPQNQR